MAYINPYTFRQAIQLGHDVYELILTNWGNRGVGADENSLVFPLATQPDLAMSSVSGVAISPRSLIDRVRVQYRPAVPSPLFAGVSPEREPFNTFLVSARQPLVGNIQGPISIWCDPANYFTDEYIAAGTNIASPDVFGTALTIASNNLGEWVPPELRLLLYLRQPGLVSSLRYPTEGYQYSNVDSPFTTNVGPFIYRMTSQWVAGGVEQLVRAFPISGRRRVRVMVRNDGTQPASFRVTGVSGTVRSPAVIGPLTNFLREVELVSDAAVAPDACVSVIVDDPLQSFLLIKGEVDDTVGASVLFLVDAVD